MTKKIEAFPDMIIGEKDLLTVDFSDRLTVAGGGTLSNPVVTVTKPDGTDGVAIKDGAPAVNSVSVVVQIIENDRIVGQRTIAASQAIKQAINTASMAPGTWTFTFTADSSISGFKPIEKRTLYIE